jgi:hypothetical protein
VDNDKSNENAIGLVYKNTDSLTFSDMYNYDIISECYRLENFKRLTDFW